MVIGPWRTYIVSKAGIRLLFEINPVDLRTNPFKKEGMLAEPPTTSSTRARIKRLQGECNSTKTIRGALLGIQGEWNST